MVTIRPGSRILASIGDVRNDGEQRWKESEAGFGPFDKNGVSLCVKSKNVVYGSRDSGKILPIAFPPAGWIALSVKIRPINGYRALRSAIHLDKHARWHSNIFYLEEHGMQINGIECTFHHMGIPTSEKKPGERYSQLFGMYTSDSDCRTLRIQWHRFEPGSSLHPLIQTVPHVAFKVDDLDRASAGYNILLGPYEPIPGFRVVIVEDGGQPIELVQTTLNDEQLWERAETDSVLYKANSETS